MHLHLATTIAQIAHETNRAYSAAVCGDDSHAPWFAAPEWQRASSIAGVHFLIENPEATPRDTHESWLKQKQADGWVFGEVKNPTAKTHPCMLPYDELPADQRGKDAAYLGVVRGLIGFFDKEGTDLPFMAPVLADEKRVADVEAAAEKKRVADEERRAADEERRAAPSMAALEETPLTDDDDTPVVGTPAVGEG